MKKTPVLSIICIVAVLSGITVSITACSSGGSGTITETYYPVEVTFNAPAAYTGTMVIPVDFTTEPTHTITIPNLAGHNVFLVKENVSDKTAYASMTGSVNSSSLDGVPLSLSVRSVSASDTSLSLSGGRSAISAVSGTSGGITRYDFVPARDSNAGEPLSARSIAASSLADTTYDTALAVNDTREFIVPTTNDATAFKSLTAKLCASGEHCYIWVATGPDTADAVYNDSSTVDNDNQITTTQAEEMADKFDDIYPLETGILGYEYGGALVPTSTDGGVDHDPMITILVYDIGYDYNINQTSGVLGYFWSKDMLNGDNSNKAEMFYLDSHFTDYSVGYIYSTLIHEFQHMINYNRKIVAGPNSYVPDWYNEMLSLMAEDMLDSDPAIDIDAINANAVPSASRTPLFNGEYDHTSAAGGNWLSGNQVLISYADAYAFGAYLARNYGGNDLVKAMEDSDSVGIPSIIEALTFLGTGTYENAFRRYGEALVFSGNAVNGNNTFDKAVDNFKAFDIWNIKNQYYDNSDGLYYDWVHNDLSPVKGPTVWDLNQSNLPPYGIVLQSSESWLNCYGTLEITLNRPSNDKVELFLMVR